MRFFAVALPCSWNYRLATLTGMGVGYEWQLPHIVKWLSMIYFPSMTYFNWFMRPFIEVLNQKSDILM